MTIDQLQYFAAVCRIRSFSKAADQLFISQSSLSKQIKALETELGSPLFVRKHMSVDLTDTGKRLVPYATEILKQYDNILQLRSGSQNTILRITVPFNIGYCEASRGIAEFERNIPNFHIETMERPHTQMSLTHLQQLGADLCIGFYELTQDLPASQVFLIQKSPLALVVNASHPFAGREKIMLAEAREEKFCFPRDDPALFDYYISSCVRCGFSPVLTNSDVRLGVIKRYISLNLRCTLQPLIFATGCFSDPSFCVIEITDVPPLSLSIIGISKKGRASYGTALIHSLTG